MQLNKYLAQAGISSRRKSVELIKQRLVSVNNAIIDNPAHILEADDQVRLNKKIIKIQTFLYILLNKPKGYITSTADEKERSTVMELLGDAFTKHRLYPVGRLDRETTGLLLITNDGTLAQKLSHPRYDVRKTYFVTLDRPFQSQDFAIFKQGVKLADGPASVDQIVCLNQARTKLKVIVHSGKNRIIRRIFAHFSYNVIKLDRVCYADLTKKDLSVGRWRFLTAKEVERLRSL